MSTTEYKPLTPSMLNTAESYLDNCYTFLANNLKIDRDAAKNIIVSIILEEYEKAVGNHYVIVFRPDSDSDLSDCSYRCVHAESDELAYQKAVTEEIEEAIGEGDNENYNQTIRERIEFAEYVVLEVKI